MRGKASDRRRWQRRHGLPPRSLDFDTQMITEAVPVLSAPTRLGAPHPSTTNRDNPLPCRGPAFDGGRLLRRSWRSRDDVGPEHERDDAESHVLVDPGQALRCHIYAGFFANLTANPGVWTLVQFEDTARQLPCSVVPALDDQNPIVVVGDHRGDADRVTWCLAHGRTSEENTQ